MKSCSGVAQWGTWCLPWLRPWCEGRHRANPQEFQQGGGTGGWDETDNPKLGLQQEFHLPGSVNITQPNSCSSGAGDSTISGMQWDQWDLSLMDPRSPSQRKSVFPANPFPGLHQKQPDPEERIFRVQNHWWKKATIEQSQLSNLF